MDSLSSPVAYIHSGEYVFTPEVARGLLVSLATAPDLSFAEGDSQHAAELLVALASSDVKKALVSASVARKALSALAEEYRKQVEALWEEATKEATEFALLVLKNNPQKSKAEVFARDDMQSALRTPYEEAAAKAEALLHQAFTDTELETVKHLKAEFKLLGEKWQGYDPETSLLQSLVGDLHANAEAMRGRYLEALTKADSDYAAKMKKVSDDGQRRAGMTVTTLVWGQSSEVRDAAFAAAGLNKMWVATLDENTCSHCKALHGKVISPGDHFDIDAGGTSLKAYRGRLIGPPRHPWCRCHIVGTKLKKT